MPIAGNVQPLSSAGKHSTDGNRGKCSAGAKRGKAFNWNQAREMSMHPVPSAGKSVRASHEGFSFTLIGCERGATLF